MLGFAAVLLLAQTPSSHQIYHEMREILDKAQGVSFDTNRIGADAWEGEMGVSGRRPNIFRISGLGLILESDGKWRFETGNGGTSLRRVRPDDNPRGYRGFESFFEPDLQPQPQGLAQETAVSWQPNAKVWRISLAYPKQDHPIGLLVDAATKLPLGWTAPDGDTVYYKNVKLQTSFAKPPRSVGPPSATQLLSDAKNALSRYNEIYFSLKRDGVNTRENFRLFSKGNYTYTAHAMDNYRKIVRRLDQSSGKKVWEIRELFGFESFIGRPIKFKVLSQPELRMDDTPTMDVAWMINCSVPDSTKTIRLYFNQWNSLPQGYELVSKGQVVRKVAYMGFTVVDGGVATPIGPP